MLEASRGTAPMHCLDTVLPAVSRGTDVAALYLNSCSTERVDLQSERTPRLLTELPGGLTGGGHWSSSPQFRNNLFPQSNNSSVAAITLLLMKVWLLSAADIEAQWTELDSFVDSTCMKLPSACDLK